MEAEADSCPWQGSPIRRGMSALPEAAAAAAAEAEEAEEES